MIHAAEAPAGGGAVARREGIAAMAGTGWLDVYEGHTALLRAAVDAEPVGVAIIEPDQLRIVYANPAMQDIAPGATLLGERIADISPEARERLVFPALEVLRTGVTWHGRDEAWHAAGAADSTVDELYARVTMARIENGERPHVLAVVSDTTNEVSARRQLNESRWRIEQLLAQMDEAFLSLDRMGRVTYANSRALALMRKSADELLGAVIWDAAPDLLGTRFHDEYLRVVDEGEARTYEAYYEPYGLWVEVRAYAIDAGVAVYARDITQRKQAEDERERVLRELQTERLRLRAIIDNIPMAIGLTDADGKVLLLNEEVERLWKGAPKPSSIAEYGAYRGWDYETGEELLPDQWATARVLRTGEAVRDELVTIQRFDGTRAVVLSTTVPILDENGRLTGAVGITQDATVQQERIRLASTINRIGMLVVSALSEEVPFQSVLEHAAEALSADLAAYVLREEDAWRVAAARGLAEKRQGLLLSDEAVPLAVRAANEREPVVVDDYTRSGRYRGAVGEGEIDAAIVVPLMFGAEATGALVLGRKRGAPAFGQHHIDFARQLAAGLAAALSNAELHRVAASARESVARQLEVTEMLLSAAMTLSEPLDLNEVLARLLDVVRVTLAMGRVAVMRYDKSNDSMRVVYAFGADVFPVGTDLPLSRVSPQIGEAMRARRPATVDYDDPNTPQEVLERAKRVNARLAVWVPLVLEGELYGAIGMDEPGERRELTDHELSLAEAIASHASVAIQRASLFDEQREAARLNASLAEIDRIIHSSSDVDQIMKNALTEGAASAGAATAAVSFYHDCAFHVAHAAGFAEDVVGLVIPEDAERHSVLALKTGETLFVEDVMTDERVEADAVAAFGIGAVCVVPLRLRDGREACLYFNYADRHEFSSPQRAFFAKLASSLALSLENALLTEQRARAAELDRVLTTVDEEVNQRLDPASIYQAVLKSSAQALKCNAAMLGLLVGEHLVVHHTIGLGPLDEGISVPLSSATLQFIQELTVIDDTAADERIPPRMGQKYGIRTAMSVPLLRGSEHVGALFFGRLGEARAWTAEEVEFASRLSRHVSLSLMNAELLRTERRRSGFSDAVNAVNETIHSSLHFDEIMNRALLQGACALDAESGSIVVREGGGWVDRYIYGMSPDVRGMVWSDAELGVVEQIERDLQPANVVGLPDGVGEQARDLFERQGILSFMAVPLVLRQKVMGIMFFNRSVARAFDEIEVDFGRKLGATVSLALDNAELFSSEQRSVRLAEALNRVNELLLSTLDVDEMLERVVAEASQASGADKALVAVPAGDMWRVTNTQGLGDELCGTELLKNKARALTETAESRRPLMVEDAYNDPRVNNSFARQHGLASYILLPLVVQGQVLGVMQFGYAQRVSFDEQDLEFAQRLSNAISIALENARLYQQEREIASTLQETLLVVPGNVHDVEYARVYRSATLSARVGGDFIDVFQLDRRRVALSLGDVSGKGIEAASLTAMVRNTLRAHAVEDLPPSAVARKTNEMLRLFTHTDVFVTAFFGVLDTKTGRLTYVSAGHPPGLVLKPDGEVRELMSRSPVLGAFSGIDYEDGQCVLDHDDVLLLYSDGVIEARINGSLFGEERLAKLASELVGQAPKEVVSSVEAEVMRFSKGRLRDDMAILAVRRDRRGSRGSDADHPRLDI